MESAAEQMPSTSVIDELKGANKFSLMAQWNDVFT